MHNVQPMRVHTSEMGPHFRMYTRFLHHRLMMTFEHTASRKGHKSIYGCMVYGLPTASDFRAWRTVRRQRILEPSRRASGPEAQVPVVARQNPKCYSAGGLDMA